MNLIVVLIIVNSVLVLNCVRCFFFSIPPPKVIFFSDGGFEVSIKWVKGITLFEFHGKKNVMFNGTEPGDWNIKITKPTDGKLVYKNLDAKFEPGDVLHYWIHAIHNGDDYNSPKVSRNVTNLAAPEPQTSFLFCIFRSDQYTPSTPDVEFYGLGGGFKITIDNAGVSNFEVRYMVAGKSNHWKTDGCVFYGLKNFYIFFNLEEEFEIGDELIYSIHVTHEDVPQKVRYYIKNVTEFLPIKGPKSVDFEFLTPGFEISIGSSWKKQNTHLHLNCEINNKTSADDSKTGIELRKNDGTYIFRYNTRWFEKEDKLCFWISNSCEGYGALPLLKCSATYNGNLKCLIGVSTFGDRDKICIGSIIFEENFNKPLDLSVWTFERKFGAEPDFEFVLYSNLSTEIKEGILQITPTDFSNNDPMYEIQNCTGVPNSHECVFDRRRNRDVIAPILSSRITTKNSFSFKYGRVEVRAKLPTADWTVPFIMLEPKESKYQSDNYKSGQIHIVSMTNNPTIISTVNQGPGLGAKEPFRTIFMTKRSFDHDWYSQYHTFAVEWKPDGITTFIDGKPQVTEDWRKSHLIIPGSDAWKDSTVSAAPFDQEFYISIGVSVGGINDFQFGTPWDLTSPLQRRQFKNSSEWRSSWNYGRNVLKVDYIKVISV